MSGVLTKKVALVTGGGSGIGEACAKALAAAGAEVAIADVNLDGVHRVVEDIAAAGGIAKAYSPMFLMTVKSTLSLLRSCANLVGFT